MNWLDPAEVEAWLAAEPRPGEASFSPPMTHYALEQFVRALGARGTHDLACSCLRSGKVAKKYCDCSAAVARLLRAAMEENSRSSQRVIRHMPRRAERR